MPEGIQPVESDRAPAERCCDCNVKVEQLTARISDLMEENLRLLHETTRRNHALFETLLANSTAGITLTGPDRRIIRVVRGLTGFSTTDLTGTLIESLAVPEDQPVIVDCYRQLLSRSCCQVKREIRVPRSDGPIRRFSITLTDMLDDANVQAIVWNYHDVTAEKEQNLKGAETADA